MQIYRHTQSGCTMQKWLLLGAILVALIVSQQEGRGILPAIVIIAVGVASVWLLSSLTVAVDEREVRLWFGPGLIRKRFALAEIEDARPVRNPWWYGWGIHRTRHGWLYNVAGLEAVELQMRNGRKARIGSDEAKRLATVIRQAAGRGARA